MEIKTGFGWIQVNEKKYQYDIIMDPEGGVLKRPKELSASKKRIYGHTPLTREEIIRILSMMGPIDILVIGNGQYGKLPIENDVFEELRRRGIKVIVTNTPKALTKYLELKNKARVGAIIHITC